METVRLLTNFETPRQKLVQIVLAGQPQLAQTLLRDSLLQLRQRVSTICRLEALSTSETAEYIDHRLRIAGYSGGALFTSRALARITNAAKGTPRVINALCFNALAICSALKRKQVDDEMVIEVIRDLRLEPIEPAGSALIQEAPVKFPLLEPVHDSRPRRIKMQAIRVAFAVFVVAVCAALWQRSNNPSHRFQAVKDRPSLVGPERALNAPPPLSTNSSDRQPVEITVEPHQTLHAIAVRYLGDFDEKSLQQLRSLNPRLTDPNHIEAGQKIRLPERSGSQSGRGLQAVVTKGVQ